MLAEQEMLAQGADIILSITELHFPSLKMIEALSEFTTNWMNQAVDYQIRMGDPDYAKRIKNELSRMDMSAFAFKAYNGMIHAAIDDAVCELVEAL